MKMVKKLVAVVAALTLTIGMASTAMAASWDTWIGKTYEAAVGKISTSNDGFTAKLKSIGWMGVWGGQAHYKVPTTKGKQYTLKFKISSSKMDKYVWVKIGNDSGSVLSVGEWIDCKKGKTISFNKTFTAQGSFKMVSFGFGGDNGTRSNVKADGDAKARYKRISNKKVDGSRLKADEYAEHPTVIKVTGLSLTEASSSGGSSSSGNGTVNSNGTVNTVTTSDSTVATGDFTPIACGATAVLAAAAIVVFAKRRQED